jgi:type I restriction enzyme R subunit
VGYFANTYIFMVHFQPMNKKDLSERDICTKFINPAIAQAGWDLKKQFKEEDSFVGGRISLKEKMTASGNRKFSGNIVLYKQNISIAVFEVKDNKHSVICHYT